MELDSEPETESVYGTHTHREDLDKLVKAEFNHDLCPPM